MTNIHLLNFGSRKGLMLLGLLCLITTSCSTAVSSGRSGGNQQTAESLPTVERNGGVQLDVESVGIYSWWWSRAAVTAPEFDVDRPPKKTEYVLLKEWRSNGEQIATSPKKVDLRGSVVNNGDSVSISFRFIMSLRYFDPDEDPDTASSCSDVWINRDVVFVKAVGVSRGETKEFSMPNFDLTTILNSKSAGGQAVCAMRLSAEVLDSDAKLIASKEHVVGIFLDL